MEIFQFFRDWNCNIICVKSSIDFDASKLDVRKVQNDIALSVATAYLQILYSNEQLKATNDRIDAVTKERNRAKILVDNDLLAEGSFLMQILLATEEFNKASAENLLPHQNSRSFN